MRSLRAGLVLLLVHPGCTGDPPVVTADAATDVRVEGCGTARTLRATNAQTPEVISTADRATCSAERAAGVVRLRVCLSPPSTSTAEDAGVTYCAVVDLASGALPSLAVGSDLRLDGEARFVYPSPLVYQVRPADVTYTATAPTATIARAWMEKGCYCTPVSLGASQRLTGTLHLDPSPAGRLRGRVAMTVDGTVSPTTYLSEHVEFATGFDVAVPPEG